MKKNNYVYDERNRLAIALRLYFHRFFQLVQSITSRFYVTKFNDSEFTLLVLGINNIDDLEEFIIKSNWYLPKKHIATKIVIATCVDASCLSTKSNNTVVFTEKPNKYYNESSLILLNDWKEIFSFRNIICIGKILFIDKNYFSYVESLQWQNLYYNCLSKESLELFNSISKKNFTTFESQKSHKKIANCFVTGPSFSEYTKLSFNENELIVICNSIVKNHAFLEYTHGADLLTFADPVFHFSSNQYSKVFRENMVYTFKKYKFFIAIPMHVFPLMYCNYPELRNHLIGVVYKRHQDKYNIPSYEEMWVKDNANILTNLMVPMACSVSDQVCIIGADGRKPDEKYFWEHNSSVQFDDLMTSAFDAHPSFFRDRDYKDYYKQHCQNCDELLNHCEAFGKQFSVLTKSYIPAFSKRFYINQTVES